uniref:Uncharacterized protein n=1 Tax=Magallana gigas TaxID=29159 RepID=K1R5R1_MAGGI
MQRCFVLDKTIVDHGVGLVNLNVTYSNNGVTDICGFYPGLLSHEGDLVSFYCPPKARATTRHVVNCELTGRQRARTRPKSLQSSGSSGRRRPAHESKTVPLGEAEQPSIAGRLE